METFSNLISEFGFPIVMMVGLGYFIYFIWHFISEHIEPEIEKMHFALIRVIDQTRMLDQDMIRLQQKVNVVLEYRAKEKIIQAAEQERLVNELKKNPLGKSQAGRSKKNENK